ncbi:hypothetical protein COU60_01155 [Candidatus Pacearchaeota archaeon CG10_big_fil_rev_8_21_14_0_10_34_76]|nr:MAG: hypothetical protein COU60_01155 [Candidatus Pacearchaeota archaeon CG10_big_fil_rev_8_21_14_0_10_34_76]
MTDTRYTPEGLPRVTRATIEEYMRNYKRIHDSLQVPYNEIAMEMRSEIAMEMRRENPEIADWFAKSLKKTPAMSREVSMSMVIGASMLYGLLKEQAEKNRDEDEKARVSFEGYQLE